MKNNTRVSNAIIRRLPRYRRYLGDLRSRGVKKISSNELSELIGYTASQIRQDLNNFGGFGQQGYGYNVKYLHGEIGKILGIDVAHSMVIVGSGNLGKALANYAAFEKRGFVLTGMFDNDPEVIGTSVRGILVQPVEDLESFLTEHSAEIGVLTIPKNAAVELAGILAKHGVKAILNFAHTDLNLPEDVIVENVHISESLMRLSYNLARYNEEHHKE